MRVDVYVAGSRAGHPSDLSILLGGGSSINGESNYWRIILTSTYSQIAVAIMYFGVSVSMGGGVILTLSKGSLPDSSTPGQSAGYE